jgi:hypothetical protein
MVRDQLPNARGHLAAVAEDVSDEVPRNPVVLAALVAEPALHDPPQSHPARQVHQQPLLGGPD